MGLMIENDVIRYSLIETHMRLFRQEKMPKRVQSNLMRTLYPKMFRQNNMEKWSRHHRKSLVETKIYCIKLLDEKLHARSFEIYVNQIHACVAVLNKFTKSA